MAKISAYEKMAKNEVILETMENMLISVCNHSYHPSSGIEQAVKTPECCYASQVVRLVLEDLLASVVCPGCRVLDESVNTSVEGSSEVLCAGYDEVNNSRSVMPVASPVKLEGADSSCNDYAVVVDEILQRIIDVVELTDHILGQIELQPSVAYIQDIEITNAISLKRKNHSSSSQPLKTQCKRYEHCISSSFPTTSAMVCINFGNNIISSAKSKSFCAEFQLYSSDSGQESVAEIAFSPTHVTVGQEYDQQVPITSPQSTSLLGVKQGCISGETDVFQTDLESAGIISPLQSPAEQQSLQNTDTQPEYFDEELTKPASLDTNFYPSQNYKFNPSQDSASRYPEKAAEANLSRHDTWLQFVNNPVTVGQSATSNLASQEGSSSFYNDEVKPDELSSSSDRILKEFIDEAIVPDPYERSKQNDVQRVVDTQSSTQSDVFTDSMFDAEFYAEEEKQMAEVAENERFSPEKNGETVECGDLQISAGNTLVNTASGQLVIRCPTEEVVGGKVVCWKPWSWSENGNNEAKRATLVDADMRELNDPIVPTLLCDPPLMDMDESYEENEKPGFKTDERSSNALQSSFHEQQSQNNETEITNNLQSGCTNSASGRDMFADFDATNVTSYIDDVEMSVDLEPIVEDVCCEEDLSVPEFKGTGICSSEQTILRKKTDSQANKQQRFMEAFGWLSQQDETRNCDENKQQVPEMSTLGQVAAERTSLDQEVPQEDNITGILEDGLYPDVVIAKKGFKTSHDEDSCEEESERSVSNDELANYDQSITPAVQTNKSNYCDKLYPVTPLKTCSRPLRVGLSRHRNVSSLHKSYVNNSM